jgi:hypothetical protein
MSVEWWKFAGSKSSARVGCLAADGAGVGVSAVDAGPGGEADLDAAGVAVEDDGVSHFDARHADVSSTAQHALHTLAHRRPLMRPPYRRRHSATTATWSPCQAERSAVTKSREKSGD